jgi:hypothetical protein
VSIDLDDLERLAKAATPGPWDAGTCEGEVWSDKLLVVWDALPNDAAYIAAANPPTILALIARLRAAEAVAEGVAAYDTEMDAQGGASPGHYRTALAAWRAAKGAPVVLARGVGQ